MKKLIIILVVIIGILVSVEIYRMANPPKWMTPPDTLFQAGNYSYVIKNEKNEIMYQADLVVTNLSNPKFDFNISVGTSGGAGEIKGTTESLTPMSAQAKINEFEKVCTLTFEAISSTTPVSIKVTEDDCLEYHGASVQFEHQYVKTE